MSLPVGEMFMFGFRGATVPRWLDDFAAEFGLGGVILFDYDCLDRKYQRNIFSPAQVRELCAEIHALPSKPRVYVDQEGGKVRRLKEKYGFAPLASAKQFPALSVEAQCEQLTVAFTQMRDVGIDCNLAPVIDLDLNPANPDLGAVERCYSADPEVLRQVIPRVVEAARAAGVDLCLKHFPGCGAATVNSHEELMDLSDVVTPGQIAAFAEFVRLVPAILFSHGVVREWDAQLPVSLSPAAVKRARAWRDDALLLTDDLQMEGLQKRMDTGTACEAAARAGLDLICVGHNMRDEQLESVAYARRLRRLAEGDPAVRASMEKSLVRLRARKGG